MQNNISRVVSQWTSKRGISGSALKLIAIITMVIDHIGLIFFEEGNAPVVGFETTEYILRFIGRLSFPIFAFLIAEGMSHTKNIYRYALRILAMALICEIPYDIASKGVIFEWGLSNIFFTFFLAIAPVMLYRFTDSRAKDSKDLFINKYLKIFVLGFSAIFCMGVAYYIGAVYSYAGVMLTLTFYVFRRIRPFDLFFAAGVMFATWHGSLQLAAIFALPIILLYNGQRGFIRTKKLQYAFYLIYPVHLLILYGIFLLIN